MPIEITMPALSPTMEEGNLSKWLVKEGDTVASGDIIAEIETDKATMEVEAVDEGTIAKIVVDEGTEAVKVNSLIAILAEEGEDVEEAASSASSSNGASEKPKDDKETKAAEQKSEPADEKKQETSSQKEEAVSPKANSAAPTDDKGDRIFATPLARRIAKENDLDLSQIDGSGPHGRIVKADVEGKSASSQQSAATETKESASSGSGSAPMASGMSDDQVLALFKEGELEKIPHDGMRKTIAARLTQSSQTIPVYYLSVNCKLDALLALRKQINGAAPMDEEKNHTYRVSVNDFIIKAMALALQAVPQANASWTSTDRILHKHSDVGVAVAIPDGLITPIIRRAEEKPLSVISNEMKDLANRARDKKLKPEEYQGGSTAVSNLGMFGVSNFTSIINPPHASIVSIGAGEQTPVVVDGAVQVATVMTASFAFDHRVIDGALGAKLAGAFKGYLEKPMSMLV